MKGGSLNSRIIEAKWVNRSTTRRWVWTSFSTAGNTPAMGMAVALRSNRFRGDQDRDKRIPFVSWYSRYWGICGSGQVIPALTVKSLRFHVFQTHIAILTWESPQEPVNLSLEVPGSASQRYQVHSLS